VDRLPNPRRIRFFRSEGPIPHPKSRRSRRCRWSQLVHVKVCLIPHEANSDWRRYTANVTDAELVDQLTTARDARFNLLPLFVTRNYETIINHVCRVTSGDR
jgi:hypothetical protein